MKVFMARAAIALSLTFLMTWASKAEGPQYKLRFPAPENHYVEVEALFPASGEGVTEVFMAVWTPGSYKVRDYSRNLEGLEARDSAHEPLAVSKIEKNRWRIMNPGGGSFTVSYRLYCRERSVRTNWVEASYAVLNGAGTFLSTQSAQDDEHHVELNLPTGWAGSWTGLRPHPSRRPNHYIADSFDTLIDSPILAGNAAVYEFSVGGKPHFLVNEGESGIWNGPRSAEDVEKIVREHLRFWGGLPYERYLFLNLINEGGGGLEHKNSTLMMTSRWRSRVPEEYRRWLGLVSHEFFHTWNVKRLRPVELGPFNYEDEVYTSGLWIAEGFTSYYGNLLVRRAGLLDDKEYLKSLSSLIGSLQSTPGRRVRSLEQSSFDAWIKHYQPDENSLNSTISYYTKGAVVAFLLDARIRKSTDGVRSLDDVMRLAYQRFSGKQGFTPKDFRDVVAEVARQEVADWLEKASTTTDELRYDEAMAWFGLRFRDPKEKRGESGDDGQDEREPRAWLGLDLNEQGSTITVRRVRSGTPAYQNGFNVGDEIVAVDGFRLLPGEWKKRMMQYRRSDKAAILIARRQQLMTIEVVFDQDPGDRWRIAIDEKAAPAQERQRTDWLGRSN